MKICIYKYGVCSVVQKHCILKASVASIQGKTSKNTKNQAVKTLWHIIQTNFRTSILKG